MTRELPEIRSADVDPRHDPFAGVVQLEEGGLLDSNCLAADAPLAGLDATSCRHEALAFLLETERRGGPGCLDLTAGFEALQTDAEYASLRERWLAATRGR